MIRLLVLLLGGGMFAAAVALGRVAVLRVLRGREERPAVWAPVPDDWPERLNRLVPLAARLTEVQRQRLLQKTQQLLNGCRWEGCAGLELTEEMRFAIAAQACLLVLEHSGDPYPGLETVLVYPATYRPRHFSWTPAAEAQQEEARLGESWKHGIVILSWDSAAAGIENATDGHNVVMHEFAHQLDTADGTADGVPRLPAGAYAPWAAMLERDFEQLIADAENGHQGVLDHYGTTNRAEFFAVATEAFFERPVDLKAERPALYEALRNYYRQDPAVPATWGGALDTTMGGGLT